MFSQESNAQVVYLAPPTVSYRRGLFQEKFLGACWLFALYSFFFPT
jgi:hypothetical protein